MKWRWLAGMVRQWGADENVKEAGLEGDFPQLQYHQQAQADALSVCLSGYTNWIYSLHFFSMSHMFSLSSSLWPVSANRDVKHSHMLNQTVQTAVSILQFTNSFPANKVGAISVAFKWKEKKRDDFNWKRVAKNILYLLHEKTKESLYYFFSLSIISFEVDILWGQISSTFQSFFLPFWLVAAEQSFSFSDVQRGRTAGASVSTAEQQLAVQRQTKSQRSLTGLQHFTLLMWYITSIASCSGLGSIRLMVACRRLGKIK